MAETSTWPIVNVETLNSRSPFTLAIRRKLSFDQTKPDDPWGIITLDTFGYVWVLV